MLKQLVVATALTCGAAVAYAQTPPATSPSSMPRSNTASAPATESTGDFNKAGDMSGSAIIGAKVHDTANKNTVGSVQNIYLDESGKVKTVVLSVGGFLGVGSKDVGVKWEDIKFGKDGKSLSLTTDLTKDQLKGMPDYDKSERQKPADTAGKSGG
jgi:sporulation protein YlmC with PRC-barrel domain